MFILDAGNSRVQKWFPGATFGVTVLAATLSSPLGMQIDPLGNLAIADTNYHRVQFFAVWCRKFFSLSNRACSINCSFLPVLRANNNYDRATAK